MPSEYHKLYAQPIDLGDPLGERYVFWSDDRQTYVMGKKPDQDSHVQLYDVYWFSDIRIKAKQAGNHALTYRLKELLNLSMMPFRQVRQLFQYSSLKAVIQELNNGTH